jgi:hypothetical protein
MQIKNLGNKFLKKTFIICLYSIAILTSLTIVYHLVLRVGVNPQPKLASKDQVDSPQVFIAEQKASAKSVVEEKVVAKKIDLERKVIRLKQGASPDQVEQKIKEKGAQIVTKNDNIIVAKVPKTEVDNLKTDLAESNQIDSLEVDYPTFLAADSYDWGVERIEAPEVWDTTSAAGMKVAVIDTGIDYTHPDLQQRYAGGYDTVNEDDDPFDDHGHGTHVSGIIAADLNETGQAGVSPKANIIAVKSLAGDGTGYISDLVEAIDWAMNNDVALINFSLGTSYDSQILEDKLQEAANQGIILVAAAGNTSGGAVLYPAAYDQVISVAATDSNDNFASFSSVGAEIAAPGVSVSSTIPGGGYASWSGTSMAAPHVTATVALMMANNQKNIRENLRNSAIDLGPSGTDSYFGYGLVHSKPAALGEDTLDPVVTFLNPDHESTVKGEVTVELDVQDESKLEQIELWIDQEKVKIWQEDSEEGYQYQWNTTDVEEGAHQLLAKALDEYGNIGQAKLELEVDQDKDLTPTPSISATPSPAVSPTSSWYDRGNSTDNRQDVNQEPAMEHRQNEENAPEWSNSNQEEGKMDENYQTGKDQADSADESKKEKDGNSTENVPPVTNSNQRQQRPVNTSEVSTKSNQGEAGSKSNNAANNAKSKKDNPGKAVGRVKGAQTQAGLWQRILSLFF